MTKEFLEKCLAEGLSLRQIGERVDRSPSTVSYHLKKHGLSPVYRGRHASRGGIPRASLAPLLERGLSLRAIARELDRSPSNVRYWTIRYGIHVPRSKANRKAALDALARGENTVELNCRTHGLTDFYVSREGHYHCKRCRTERVARWRRNAKLRLVAEFGGRCEICGYAKCSGSLQFHHVDPEQKSFGLAMQGQTRSYEAFRREARKCILLCANCHAEVERGVTPIPDGLLERFVQPGDNLSAKAD